MYLCLLTSRTTIVMTTKFEPIAGKCGDIIEWFMASPDMPQDDEILFKLRLCIEEAVENVVSYAYTGGNGWMEAGTERKDNVIYVWMKDAGIPFDPLAKPDPDITLPAEERQIGGLGIFLCKQLMDSVSYRFEDGCNIFTMSKKC